MSTDAIDYRQGSASAADIQAHLHACDACFHIPLSQRVDIPAYSAKLADNAVTFEAWRGAVLVGLVAAYFNDPAVRPGFISNVSVDPDAIGAGIASRLLQAFIDAAQARRLQQIELHVSPKADAAVALYRKLGFVESGGDTETLTMRLTLTDPTQR
ncbi:MAG: GNAT family N-acetyltransferase [Luteimonas sp.]